jgi:hypothetical protein
LINTDDLREGTEPSISLDFDVPAEVVKEKPIKKSKKKWSEPKPTPVV